MGAALIEESVFEDFVGFGETVCDVAEGQRDAFVDVAFFAVIVNAWLGRGESFFRIGDGGEEVVFDVDEIEGFEGGEFFASDYGGYGIADVTNVIDAEGLLVLTDGEDAVFDGDIFAGEDQIDAGMGLGAGDVDFFDTGVGMRGAEEFAMGHAGKKDIVGVAGLAGDFGAGVDAAAGLADNAQFVGVGGFDGSCVGSGWRIFLDRHVGFSALRGCLLLFGDFEHGGFDGFEDLKIAGAAAEVAGEGFADLVAGGICVLFGQGFWGDQDCGGAVAALGCAQVGEGVLQRMEVAVFAEAFHGEDALVVAFECEEQAGEDGLAVKKDGAGAAFA